MEYEKLRVKFMSKKFFKRKLTILTAIFAIVMGITFLSATYVSAKNTSAQKQIKITNTKSATDTEKLMLIDKYQKKYFEIIKRNDVLLFFEDVPELNNDRKDLKKLFAEVTRKVKNKSYLKEYKQIEKKYSQCDCYDATTTCINEFAENHNKEADALLNTVYKEVQAKISPEDFKKLAERENKWLKEVENYEKSYNAMEFGSLGTSAYYDYQTDMKNFRTLLLMLFL